MQHKTRFRYTFILTMLAIVLIVSGCGSANSGRNAPSSPAAEQEPSGSASASPEASPSAAPAEQEFRHELGSIRLSSVPERIVAPYLEDALITLGITPVAKWSYGALVQEYLEPYLPDVPKLDFTDGLNKEALMAADPDLVVLYTTNMADEAAYKQFSAIAPTYVFNDATVDWKNTLRVLGGMTNATEKAEAAIQSYDDKVAEAKEKLKPFVEGKTFAVIRAKPKEIQLMDGTYYSGPVLYSDLGLTPHKLVKELSWDYAASLSLEILPDLDADYLFVLVQGEQARPLLDEFQESALWKNLPAVKNGRVFEMPSNYWMASGAIAHTKKIDDVLKALVK